MGIMSYRDLKVWQRAMDLVVEVYRLVKLLPKEETYALSDQMRRAAVSIPSNIAEGHSINSTKEYIQFIAIAQGSTSELETQLLICERLNYYSYEQVKQAFSLTDEVGKMLSALKRSLTPNP